MEQESLGAVMLKETARAIPWGVMLLIIFLIAGGLVKQEVKEAVEYSLDTAIKESKQAILDPEFFGAVKQNIKEAVEYSLKTAVKESKKAMLDPEVFVAAKQNAKEAIQYTTKSAADEYIRAQRQSKTKKESGRESHY